MQHPLEKGARMRTKQSEREVAGPDEHSLARVEAELQRHPHILMRLAENSLTVAQSMRDNYFRNTAKFISDVRRAIQQAQRGERTSQVLHTEDVSDSCWADFQDEVVSF